MLPYGNVIDLIGNTPMVDVSALSPNPNVRIVAKLESQNPFGSVKDRIAKSMIEQAEKDGALVPGQTIIEPSSGNTGIALAAIAGMKGYPIKILMPESVSIERRQMLEVFGAELILTPGEEGSNGAVRRAQEMAAANPQWCFMYQYANDANPRAHYEGTGPEIWRDLPEITHFVAGLGTSGTLMGTGRFLKEQNPGIKIIAIEPPLGERVGPAQSRRWLHPAGVRELAWLRTARPQARCTPTREHRMDPPFGSRVRHLCWHLSGCSDGRRGQGSSRNRERCHCVHRVRRRLEVSLYGRLHRRSRCSRGQGRIDYLLLDRAA